MATLAQQKSFVQMYGAQAQRAANAIGVPPSYILGQWALETGYGTQFAGTYNLGNVQGNNPKPYSYASLDEGVNAYIKVMRASRYSNAVTANNPVDFGRELKAAGYATDPNYAYKIATTIQSIGKFVGEVINPAEDFSDGKANPIGPGVGFFDNPTEWFKQKSLNIVFISIGVLGLYYALLKSGGDK